MVIIKNPEFVLRPLTLSDAKFYFEVMKDKQTQKNLTSVPNSLARVKQEIKKHLKEVKEKDSKYFTIEVNESYAGNIVLQHQNWDKKSREGI